MRNREERVRAREARKEREAEEEGDRETDDEQGGEAAKEQQQDRNTVARRTGITLKAPTIAGNPEDATDADLKKFLDELIHHLRENANFRDDARKVRSNRKHTERHGREK